jgi:hypothetical protein
MEWVGTLPDFETMTSILSPQAGKHYTPEWLAL